MHTLWAILLSWAAIVPDAAAGTAPDVRSEVLGSGAIDERVAGDDADLVLFYGGEQRGELGPCGCDVRPRGGLGRIAGYVDASGDTPAVLVNAGSWLSSDLAGRPALSDEATARNRWMRRAVSACGFDALNVSYDDLPGLVDGAVPGLVSANLRPPLEVPVLRYRVVEAGEVRVAVTGVSRRALSRMWPEGTTWTEPVAAVEALLPAMRAEADLVVVLVHDLAKEAARIAALDVDVVVEADRFTARWEPITEHGAIWVRSYDGTQRLGELRLWLEDGRVVRALDRHVDLDDAVPEDPRIRRLRERAAVEAADRALAR